MRRGPGGYSRRPRSANRRSARLRDFATRNLVPFTWLDVETDDQADALLRQFNIALSETPVVIGRNGTLRKNPSIQEFAACAGLTAALEDDHVYDVVIVGAGPAGSHPTRNVAVVRHARARSLASL